MKTLHLTLKKKWFDMIASGEKKEEYRDLKKYWAKRFMYKIKPPFGGYFFAWSDIEKKDFQFSGWAEATGDAPVFEEYDTITFRNGYAKNAPEIVVEFLGFYIGPAKPEWSDNWPGEVFILKLGKIISKS